MTKKLNWRLKELPTADEIASLVEQSVITKEEARKMLFKDKEDISVKELEDRIEFLEGIIDALTSKTSSTTILYPIRYSNYGWFSGGGWGSGSLVSTSGTTYTLSASNATSSTTAQM